MPVKAIQYDLSQPKMRDIKGNGIIKNSDSRLHTRNKLEYNAKGRKGLAGFQPNLTNWSLAITATLIQAKGLVISLTEYLGVENEKNQQDQNSNDTGRQELLLFGSGKVARWKRDIGLEKSVFECRLDSTIRATYFQIICFKVPLALSIPESAVVSCVKLESVDALSRVSIMSWHIPCLASAQSARAAHEGFSKYRLQRFRFRVLSDGHSLVVENLS